MRYLEECLNAIHWGNSLRAELVKTKNLGYLLLLAILVSFAIGLLLFLIDPAINSPVDGIWSAWVTMTHVGFGDVVPGSFLGRLLAAGLILCGLVLFSLFTALVSVTLIGANRAALEQNMRNIGQDTACIQSAENRILDELALISKRMEALEQHMSSETNQDRPFNSGSHGDHA